MVPWRGVRHGDGGDVQVAAVLETRVLDTVAVQLPPVTDVSWSISGSPGWVAIVGTVHGGCQQLPEWGCSPTLLTKNKAAWQTIVALYNTVTWIYQHDSCVWYLTPRFSKYKYIYLIKYFDIGEAPTIRSKCLNTSVDNYQIQRRVSYRTSGPGCPARWGSTGADPARARRLSCHRTVHSASGGSW